MPEQLFVFIQLEFPWVLGAPDGRYLLRAGADGEAEHVVVLGTLATTRASGPRYGTPGAARWARRARAAPATPEPAPVASTRVTVVDPVSLSAEVQARSWLDDLDRERDVRAAVQVVNRVLHSQRIAAADPYVHEVSPAQALVIRAGWGEGEQVADGLWLHARELPWQPDGGGRRRGGRSAALRPQERLAVLLGGRGSSLICEELALRARLDVEHGRPAHAALELAQAYAAALSELRAENRPDLAIRVAELEQLRPGVIEQAQAALERDAGGADGEIVAHALERLEATLRARTAAGFNVKG